MYTVFAGIISGLSMTSLATVDVIRSAFGQQQLSGRSSTVTPTSTASSKPSKNPRRARLLASELSGDELKETISRPILPVVPCSTICTICLEPIGHKRIGAALRCGHAFHGDCLSELSDKATAVCPNCRRPFAM